MIVVVIITPRIGRAGLRAIERFGRKEIVILSYGPLLKPHLSCLLNIIYAQLLSIKMPSSRQPTTPQRSPSLSYYTLGDFLETADSPRSSLETQDLDHIKETGY